LVVGEPREEHTETQRGDLRAGVELELGVADGHGDVERRLKVYEGDMERFR
jgi:hypothetical protein